MGPRRHPEPLFESARDRVRCFVQGMLGCACPDAVFERSGIEFAPSEVAEALFEIVVGDRLLLRAYRVTPGVDVASALARWLEAGQSARDARGLNRLRLVLATESPVSVEQSAAPAFEQLRGADDHAHLHVLGLNQLDGLFALPC